MNRKEARAATETRLNELRGLSYNELLRRYSTDLGNGPEWEISTSEAGTIYNLKLYAFWDGAPGQNLRVWVDADDGSDEGFHRPETDCFIITPDGSFVGE